MWTYILHGGGASVRTSNNQTYFAKIASWKSSLKVLLVYFASLPEQREEKFRQGRQLFEAYAHVTCVLASEEHFLQEVEQADVIYFTGGYTPLLQNTLARYSNLKEKLIGKLVVGSSAGACVMASQYYTHDDHSIAQGLGWLSISIITHYTSEDEQVVEELRKHSPESPLVLLKEGEWIQMESEEVKNACRTA